MELIPLRPDDPVLRRYVAELWLPYNRELAEVVSSFELTDDCSREELIDAEVAFRRDWLDENDRRAWLAVTAESGDVATDDDSTTDDSTTDDSATDDDRTTDDSTTDDSATDDDRTTGAELAGFVTCEGDRAPPVFDRPDRMTVGDIYVRPPFRGDGLADRLVERVAAYAQEAGYEQLRLEVHEANDRAMSFYRSLGFETHRRVMTVPTDRIRE